VALDHAHHAVRRRHHVNQFVPVLRADPAADLRRPELPHQHDHVSAVRDRLHQPPVRLRRRHGRAAGAGHRPVQRTAVQGDERRDHGVR